MMKKPQFQVKLLLYIIIYSLSTIITSTTTTTKDIILMTLLLLYFIPHTALPFAMPHVKKLNTVFTLPFIPPFVQISLSKGTNATVSNKIVDMHVCMFTFNAFHITSATHFAGDVEKHRRHGTLSTSAHNIIALF